MAFHTVIVGGNFGGLNAAKEIEKKVREREQTAVATLPGATWMVLVVPRGFFHRRWMVLRRCRAPIPPSPL
jgi:hypothetical protein